MANYRNTMFNPNSVLGAENEVLRDRLKRVKAAVNDESCTDAEKLEFIRQILK